MSALEVKAVETAVSTASVLAALVVGERVTAPLRSQLTKLLHELDARRQRDEIIGKMLVSLTNVRMHLRLAPCD
jgi:hypothetical protein